jgi:hypothetical protein
MSDAARSTDSPSPSKQTTCFGESLFACNRVVGLICVSRALELGNSPHAIRAISEPRFGSCKRTGGRLTVLHRRNAFPSSWASSGPRIELRVDFGLGAIDRCRARASLRLKTPPRTDRATDRDGNLVATHRCSTQRHVLSFLKRAGPKTH